MIRSAIDHLRPSERLTALALASLLALALVMRPEGWGLRAFAFFGMLLMVFALSRPRSISAALIRDFAPVTTVLGVFLLLQPLVANANSTRWDATLASLDLRWFGPLLPAWRGAFGRPAAFTDLVYAAYASFYLLPLSVAILARFRGDPGSFERVVFTILLGFYLSFLGYFLWPAEGPRVPQALEVAQLGGGAISQGIRAFLRAAETTTLDAFPSGHTALSVIPALLATRRFPRLAPLFCIWAFSIVFATVYIGVHYVVDVVAGLILAGLTLALAPWLSRRMDSGRPGITSLAPTA